MCVVCPGSFSFEPLTFLILFCQLFGFVERYGAPSTVKTNKENQKTTGLQNFLLTLQQEPEKEGEFRYCALRGREGNVAAEPAPSWDKGEIETCLWEGKTCGRSYVRVALLYLSLSSCLLPVSELAQ